MQYHLLKFQLSDMITIAYEILYVNAVWLNSVICFFKLCIAHRRPAMDGLSGLSGSLP
jgi:hypothetical protein